MIKELKSIEEENKLLKQEVDYYKKQFEGINSSYKIAEKKVSLVIKYFRDYIESAQEDDPHSKKYKTLLGILTNSAPLQVSDLPLPPAQNHNFARQTNDVSVQMNTSSDGSTKWIENLRQFQQPSDTHTFDSSRNQSAGGQGSVDGKKRKDHAIRKLRKLQKKCEGFLQKIEDVEEEDRMLKIKQMEERRKGNLQKKGSLVIDRPPGKELNVRDVVTSLTQRGQNSHFISHRAVKDELSPTEKHVDKIDTTEKPPTEHKLSCKFFFTIVFRQGLQKSSSLAWMLKGSQLLNPPK